MKILINVLLLAVIGGLGYLLFDSINEPIKFKAEKDRRSKTVEDKLKQIRNAQQIYFAITGEYAGSFDTLRDVLTNGQIPFERIIGDPDDPTNMEAVIRDTAYYPAIDSIKSLAINLDSLQFVPYSDGSEFTIQADTVTYQQTLVNVVEVGTRYKEFMGKYADISFAKYDDKYDPAKSLKFGNLSAPQLSGNWE